MKRKFCIPILLFLSINVYAQHLKVKAGIKAGLALAKSKPDYGDSYPSPETKMKFGMLAGGFLTIYLRDNFLFQPGVQYIRKGYKSDDGTGHFYRQSYNYFEVPLNILFKPGHKKDSPYFLGAGLSPAFSANRYYAGIKKFDLGVNVLATYVFPIGFSISLGYTHGILNVAANNTNSNSDHNRNLFATVGYEF
jgi:hypothetical protein